MRRFICILVLAVLTVCFCASASALEASTLHNGSRGEAVTSLQKALIQLGYLSGKADGVFGNQTERAVRAFQSASGLTSDGLAGKKTQNALLAAATAKGSTGTAAETGTQQNGQTDSGKQTETASGSSTSESSASAGAASGSLFGSNYATLRMGDKNDRVKILQKALIALNYLSGKADGIFGKNTLNAVVLFQKEHALSADGLAGKKTLKALENAAKNNEVRGSASTGAAQETSGTAETEKQNSGSDAGNGQAQNVTPTKKGTAPDGSTLYLLHWYNDVKNALKNGEHLLIYDPATGISWTLRIHSRGRHCDAEPLTAADTANMVRAFGNKNTWDQKGVYVKLPSGVWTVASTHDMPHQSGTISDNNFNGHLCVHFLRDMAEAKQNDPNYGVANQETIRALWKSLTGETLDF